MPAPGNRLFGFRITNTAVGQNVFLVLSALRGNGSFKVGPCSVWILPPFAAVGVPGQSVQTIIPAPLLSPNSNGGTAFVQAVTVVTPFDFGFSNGLKVELGVQ